MHADRMAEIQDDLFQKIISIRETKGREYATDEDTLADFKEVAEEAGITPLQCWATYVKKHERAIDTFIREGAVKSESIQGRILDVIVYHILLLGLIEDMADWRGPIGVATHAAKPGDRVEVMIRAEQGQCESIFQPSPGEMPVRCGLPGLHPMPHKHGAHEWDA